MFKKVFYLGSLCALALLASCGNKQNNEEAATEADTTIVGEVVTTVEQNGDTAEVATAAVVDTLTNAPAAQDAVKTAEAPAESGAKQ